MPFKFFKKEKEQEVVLNKPVAKVLDSLSSSDNENKKDLEAASKKKYKVLDKELRRKCRSLRCASEILNIPYYRLVNIIRGLVKINKEEKELICKFLGLPEENLFL